MSGYTEEYIKNKLQEKLSADHVEVVDQSDGKFAALIVSNQFEGKALLARHRLVNSVLEEELRTINAFSHDQLFFAKLSPSPNHSKSL